MIRSQKVARHRRRDVLKRLILCSGQQGEATGGSIDVRGQVDISEAVSGLSEQRRGQFLAGIGTVGEEVAQPRKEIVDRGDDEGSAVAVLDVGAMQFGSDQQAGGVGDKMTLAAFDFLRCIETARPAGFGGFDRLTIDDAGRGARLATNRFARLQQQLEIDPLQHPSVTPSIEIMLHRRIGRKLPRQLPPLASGPHHIEQRIDHAAHFRLRRASQPGARRQPCRDYRYG